ncbi:hypothetical protein LY78DRAFT_424871 [Colletotrichum sublineola]|nr:hypothetical protein LY78DRAFT_424871 [Colletotrichum sublineola]
MLSWKSWEVESVNYVITLHNLITVSTTAFTHILVYAHDHCPFCLQVYPRLIYMVDLMAYKFRL